MPVTIEVFRGAAAIEVLTLQDRASDAVTTYTTAATLAAALWSGDDQAALVVPLAEWFTDATDGIDWWPNPWLRQQLDANRLIVRGLTTEIVAKKALSYVLEAQIGMGGDTPYEKLAARFDWQAEQLVKTYRAEIDLNADGAPD